MSRLSKFCFIFLIFLTFQINIFGKDYSHHVLDNGLEVYIVEDFSNPLCHFSLAVKAGYFNQSYENAGFFELYARLFWKETEKNLPELIDSNFNCQSLSTTYTASFTAKNIEKILDNISTNAQNPYFAEGTLQKEFLIMKESAKEFSQSPAGFINYNINNHLYKEWAWSYDTAIFPGILNCKNISQARGILTDIKNKYYYGNNCAIFISSPFDEETVLQLLNKYFGNWERKNFNEPIKFFNPKENKKTVLVSKDFSKEMNQCAIQFFSDYSNSLGQIISSNMEFPHSQFKNLLTNESETGVKEPDLANVSFMQDNYQSKIIVQALMDNKNSPIKQIDKIISIFNETNKISEDEFLFAKNIIEKSQYTDNTRDFIFQLANNWGTTETNTKDYDFSSENNIFKEEPYIFLLIHTDTYNKYAKEFKKQNYNAIFHNPKKNYLTSPNKIENKSDINLESTNLIKNIVAEKNNKLNNFQLSNGINVFTYNCPETKRIAIQFDIDGGEILQNERGLETIVIQAFAENIKLQLSTNPIVFATTTITTKTSIYKSEVLVEGNLEYFPDICKGISNALTYGEISHGMTDELINREKSRYRMAINDMVFQENLIALRTLYSGTKLENLANNSEMILSDVDYNKILALYASLTNSKRFSITLGGNFSDLDNTKKILEENFSFFKGFQIDEKIQLEPTFSNMTMKQKLRRIFTSDIPAEKAGRRPLHLIPTTVFYDPSTCVISGPSNLDINWILFKALSLELTDIIESKSKNEFKTDIEKANVYLPEENLCHASFVFTKSKSIKNVKKLFEESLIELKNHINNDNIEKIKSNCLVTMSQETQTISQITQIISKNFHNSQNHKKWIENFTIIDNATTENFMEVFQKYFENPTILWIFSADTKK